MRSLLLVTSLFISMLVTTTSFALETDQFISGNIELRDASLVMNQYFIDKMDQALVWANSKDANNVSCQEVALKTMSLATGTFTLSAASDFASRTPLIERYPEDSVTERGHINQSFYEHAWLPLQVVDLARTISINNIHVGTDKFGHFSHMGLRYYKHYLKLKNKGVSEEEAIKQAITSGFGSEYGILGYGIDGVLSYGDLEANYQGFIFSLDMCRGKNPYLIKKENNWIANPNHLFTAVDYFTPKMDESYNLSFWRMPLYKRVKEKLQSEYCEMQKDPAFLARMNYYHEFYQAHSNMVNSINDQLIEANIKSQDRFARSKEDIEKGCGK